MEKSKGRLAKRILIALAIVVALLGIAVAWYVNDYYHASDTANAVVADENGDDDGIVVKQIAANAIAFVPERPTAGFIFYPGAKVQPEAYAPLMQQCAERGILCVIVKPLFNLAIIDGNCADGIRDRFPDTGTWLIGGHSMGGVAASNYAAAHQSDFKGLALLASYPTADLSKSDIDVVSIAGTNDQVLNREKCEKASSLLPANTVTVSIEGGNHACFGDYGDQNGDGEALISRQQQQEQTVDAIVNLVESEAR